MKLTTDALDKFPAEFQTTLLPHVINHLATWLAGAIMLPAFGVMILLPLWQGAILGVALGVLVAYLVLIRAAKKVNLSPSELLFVVLPQFAMSRWVAFLFDCGSGVLNIAKIFTATFQSPANEIDVHLCRSTNEFFMGDEEYTYVAHLSDLHLTRNKLIGTCEGHPSPNDTFQRLITEHLDVLRRCHFLVVTGDITDSGRTAEWNEFLRLIEPVFANDSSPELVICPGNHDFNITDSRQRWIAERAFMPGRKLRVLRYFRVSALSRALHPKRRMYPDIKRELQHENGRRAVNWATGDARTGVTKNSLESGYVDAMNSLDTIIETNFPFFSRTTTDIGQVVFDSSRPGGNIVSNALGRISHSQLKRFERLKALFFGSDNRLNFVFIHHHLVRVPKSMVSGLHKRAFGAIQSSMMILLNSRKVVQLLGQYPRVVVFHGHRHIYSRHVTRNGVTVVSAPSTTLGCENNNHMGPGFFILAIQPAGETAQLVKEYFCS